MSYLQKLRWRNVSIGVKLSLSFAAIMLLFILTAAYNYVQMKTIETNMEESQERMQRYETAEQLKHYTLELSLLKSNLMVFHDAASASRYVELNEQIQPLIAQISATASTREQRMWRNQLQVSAGEYLDFFDQALRVLDDPTLSEDDRQERLLNLHRMSEIHKAYILQVVDNFTRVYRQEAAGAEELMLHNMRAARAASLMMPSLSTLLAVLLSAWCITQIRRPIHKLRAAVQAIAEGDLSQKIASKTNDEFGILSRYFNIMIRRIGRMLGNTQRVASQLKEHSASFQQFSHVTADANGMIVRALKEISSGADEQASLTEESRGQAVEMRGEMNSIRKHATAMNEQSLEAMSLCKDGSLEVESLKESAVETEWILDQLGQSMEQLAEQSLRIGEITSSISEFAQQTNILALNASIVAAHAGQDGKGFNVIASEIRELSDKSRDAAASIHEMISLLESQMADVKANMQTVRSAMNLQHAKVDGTYHAFERIQQTMNIIHEQISHIHQQISQSEERQEAIVTAVETMTKIAEETAAGAQEINSSAELQDQSVRRIAARAAEINDLSLRLFQEISRFKLAEETCREGADHEDEDKDLHHDAVPI